MNWTLDDSGKLTISGTGPMTDFLYPNQSGWYKDRLSIKEVVIESGATSIGKYSFFECEYLQSVTLAAGITSIGSGAFYSCGSLTDITIPTGVTSIGENAFCGCVSLTTVTLPSTLTGISQSAFRFAGKLSSITLPEGLLTIGDRAFDHCVSLTTVTIPGTVTYMSENAFDGCISLVSIDVASGNTILSSQNGILFDDDKSDLIKYPAAKTGTSYTVPNTVTRICGSAFMNNPNLTSITITDSVSNLDASAFSTCPSLTTINVSGGTHYSSEDGILYNYGKTTLIKIPEGKTMATFTVPATVNDISGWGIHNMQTLQSIEVAAGNTAFASVDGVLFTYDLSGLRLYPTGKTDQSYNIPANVTAIHSIAFVNNTNLKEITVASGNTQYTSQNGVLYNADGTQLIKCPSGKESYTIPSKVNIILSAAFSGDCLKEIIFDNGGTVDVYSRAFWNCTNLETIKINNPYALNSSGAFFYDDAEDHALKITGPGGKYLQSASFEGKVTLTYDATSDGGSSSKDFPVIYVAIGIGAAAVIIGGTLFFMKKHKKDQ